MVGRKQNYALKSLEVTKESNHLIPVEWVAVGETLHCAHLDVIRTRQMIRETHGFNERLWNTGTWTLR